MARIRWQPNGEADVVLLDDDRIELRSSAPFAPGSRPKGELVSLERPEIWVKVHRSTREADGRYYVWGRLLNATRSLRVALASLCPSTAAPQSSTIPTKE